MNSNVRAGLRAQVQAEEVRETRMGAELGDQAVALGIRAVRARVGRKRLECVYCALAAGQRAPVQHAHWRPLLESQLLQE